MDRGPDSMTHKERLRMLALFSLWMGRLEEQAGGKGNHKDKEGKLFSSGRQLSKGKQPQTDI